MYFVNVTTFLLYLLHNAWQLTFLLFCNNTGGTNNPNINPSEVITMTHSTQPPDQLNLLWDRHIQLHFHFTLWPMAWSILISVLFGVNSGFLQCWFSFSWAHCHGNLCYPREGHVPDKRLKYLKARVLLWLYVFKFVYYYVCSAANRHHLPCFWPAWGMRMWVLRIWGETKAGDSCDQICTVFTVAAAAPWLVV